MYLFNYNSSQIMSKEKEKGYKTNRDKVEGYSPIGERGEGGGIW